MRRSRSLWVLWSLTFLFSLVTLITPSRKAAAFDVTVSPSGVTASTNQDYRGVVGTSYKDANNYRIKSATFSFTGRRTSSGSSTTNDYTYLYYKTCVGCGWSSIGPYYANSGTLGYTNKTVDLTPYGNVVEVAMYLYTQTGLNSETATASVTSVVIDSPPWTPGTPSIAGPGVARSVNPTGSWQTWYSAEFVGAKKMTGARFLTTNIYGDAYLQGWNSNTNQWVNLITRSYNDNVVDQWWDGRSQTTYNITKLRVYQNTYTGYGAFSEAYVPQVYYFDAYGTPVDIPDSRNQIRIAWTANNNPAGTVYEVSRREYNSAGVQVSDTLDYSGTNLEYVTDDLQPAKYYKFRVRAKSGGNTSADTTEIAYWVPPVPSVTRDNAKLSLSWTAPYPSLSYWVWYRQAGSVDWSGGWQTSATSYTIDPGWNSPWNQYEVALTPPGSLPNGGPMWPVSDGQKYRPKWPAPYAALASNVTATSARIWWQINYNSSWNIDSGVNIRITRSDGTNTVTLPTTTTAAASGNWYTPSGASYGYWGYVDQTGLTPGLTYTYSICALNPDNECGPARTVTVTPKPITPGTPTLSAASTTHQVKIDWTQNGNAAGTTYEVWRKTVNPDGSVARDERIFTGTDTYTYTTTGTYAQSAGKYYRYRARTVVSGVNSDDTSEVAYWTAPPPSVTRSTAGFNLSWTLPDAPSTQSTGGALRISSSSCSWVNTSYWYVPNGTTSRVRVTFTGNTNDAWGLYAYSPSYGYYWVIPQANVPSGTYDAWIDLQYPADRLRTYTHDCGGGGATMDVPEFISPSSTTVNVEYSTNGTSWSSYTSGSTAEAISIPSPGTLTPAQKYQLALTPNSLPNGGTAWRSVNSTWYSPLWTSPVNALATGVNGTSARIWWQISTGSSFVIDQTAKIRITRSDGQTPLNGVTTQNSNGAYTTPSGGSYGYWGYIDQSGLTPGVTYTWTICALNANDECGDADTVTVTPKPLTPTTPTLAAATNTYQVKVDWTANGNSSGTTYEVWRKTLKPDGTVLRDERIFSGVDTYTYTTAGTYAQDDGDYYRYRVIAVVGGVSSAATAEVDYWTPPVPAVSNGVNTLDVSWNPPLSASTQSAGTALRISSSSCSWNSTSYWYVPNSGTTSRIRVTFSGNTGDQWGLYAYAPSYGYYWVISQQNVPSGTYDQWIDLPYAVDRLRTYVNDCGGSGGATMDVPEYIAPSPTQVTVQYSSNGTSWSNHVTGNGSGSQSIPAPSPLSPAQKYQIGLLPTSLPNGGTAWRAVNTTWYSPLWREMIQNNNGTVSQTSAQLWWATGEYSDNTRPSRSSKVQLSRDGVVIATLTPGTDITYSLQTRNSRYDYWTSYTDNGLDPGTSYTYSACVLNALDQCGTPVTWSVLTLPPTPDSTQMDVQYGSYGWQKVDTAGGWGEMSFKAVKSATSYKLYISGAETRTLTINSSASAGSTIKYKVTDLESGGAYTFKISAVNSTGEGSPSGAVSFSTPSRIDSGAPTGTSIVLNDGAATTGGTRIRVGGTATDTLSGVAGIQLSNDNSTWSTTYPLYDFTQVNLITYSGGNAFFSDLGGWQTDSTAWAKVQNDSSAQSGKAVNIRWDGTTTDRWQGLDLAKNLTVTGGKQYTVQVRYKVTGMTTGRAAVWSNWLTGSTTVSSADHVFASTNGQWATETWTLTAPASANGRNITLGFDQANAGATLWVDYIVVNEGPAPISPTNSLPNPVSNQVEWNISGSSFGSKTVYARFVDAVGNQSSAVSASIQFMLTDTTAPRVSLTINGQSTGGSTPSTTVTLQITASDAESSQDLLKMRFKNDSGQWSPWEDYAPTKAWTICTGLTPSLCEGRRSVWVEVQDPAQNTGGAVADIFFRTSLNPVQDAATVWATTGSQGNYDTGSGTVTVQYVRVSEIALSLDLAKFPGVRTVRYGFDPNRYGQWEPVSATKSLSLPIVQGIQTLYMQTDAGQSYQIRFLLDFTPPEMTATWKGGATATRPGGKATLVLTGEDNVSRNEDLQVSINGGTWRAWAPEMEITLTGSGLQTVTIRVKDPAGNQKTLNLNLWVMP